MGTVPSKSDMPEEAKGSELKERELAFQIRKWDEERSLREAELAQKITAEEFANKRDASANDREQIDLSKWILAGCATCFGFGVKFVTQYVTIREFEQNPGNTIEQDRRAKWAGFKGGSLELGNSLRNGYKFTSLRNTGVALCTLPVAFVAYLYMHKGFQNTDVIYLPIAKKDKKKM